MRVRHASFPALLLAVTAVGCAGGTTTTTTPSTGAGSPSAAVASPSAAAASPVTPSAAPSADAPSDAPATDAPATDAPSAAPSGAPTVDPGASLDPALSDAGIVGRVTIANDTRDDRSGTHDIVGVAADASDCAYSFDGDEFIAVAYNEDVANGAVRQMSVTVPTDSMPANDGEQRIDISNGSAFVDFMSETGVGTSYTGAAERDEGTSTIDVTVSGDLVIFDFEAATGDDITFAGQLVCQGAEL